MNSETLKAAAARLAGLKTRKIPGKILSASEMREIEINRHKTIRAWAAEKIGTVPQTFEEKVRGVAH
jgi:hypothetical protein